MITLQEIVLTIQQRLGISYEDALEYAHTVMDLFGFEDRIIDNVLGHSERQLFYLLEKNDILTTQREEIVLHNGRKWRVHYWLLNKPLIRNEYVEEPEITEEEVAEPAPRDQQESLYSNLPASMWAARKNPV